MLAADPLPLPPFAVAAPADPFADPFEFDELLVVLPRSRSSSRFFPLLTSETDILLSGSRTSEEGVPI